MSNQIQEDRALDKRIREISGKNNGDISIFFRRIQERESKKMLEQENRKLELMFPQILTAQNEA